MPNVENNLPKKEIKKTPEQTKEQPESSAETSKSFIKKIGDAGRRLLARGAEKLKFLQGIGLSRQDQELAEGEMEEVNEEINTAVTEAKNEITNSSIGEKDPSEVETVITPAKDTRQPKKIRGKDAENRTAGRKPEEKAPKLRVILDEADHPDESEFKYEGQASPWESMPGYIRKVEGSKKSEFRKGVEIYERMFANLMERAEGESLSKKEQSGADQIEILNTELESYQEALDELNKEIDLQREKGEVDTEDMEQAERLEKEMQDLEEKIASSSPTESDKDIESTNERIDAEKEEIRQALILMYRKGDNVNSSLKKLKEELLQERNEVEKKLDSSTAQNTENLQEDIDYYGQVLKAGEAVISLDDPRVITKITKLESKGIRIDIIDANGESVKNGSQIEVNDFMIGKDRYMAMKDKRIRLKFTDQQKDILKKRKTEKEKQLRTELSNTTNTKRKRDNLTEMMEIIGEVQSETSKLDKAWKEAFREAAKEFNLEPDEVAVLKKMYKDKRDQFMEEQLQKLSVDEINKIDGKKSALAFIQENIKTDANAA